jgi:hypothetical protein
MFLLAGAGFIIYDVTRPKSKYTSMYYDVVHQKNGDLEMTPMKGMAHETTIIFLHGIG